MAAKPEKSEYEKLLGGLEGDAFQDEVCARLASLIADFQRIPADRHAIEAMAANISVPFLGIWLDAPEPTLVQRVERRTNDPSDADPGIIRKQRAEDAGEITWHRLDASMPAEVVLRDTVNYLDERSVPR